MDRSYAGDAHCVLDIEDLPAIDPNTAIDFQDIVPRISQLQHHSRRVIRTVGLGSRIRSYRRMLRLEGRILAFIPIPIPAEPKTRPGVDVGADHDEDPVVDLIVRGLVDVEDASDFGVGE